MRQRLTWRLAVVVALVAVAVLGTRTHAQRGDSSVYAFLITIDSADKRGDVVSTIRGAGSVLDLVEARDALGLPVTDDLAAYYVLRPALTPGATREIQAMGLVGINEAVPAVVRNEYANNTVLWRATFEFAGYVPAVDRAYMQMRLRARARELGATHIWEIVPGDDLSPGPDVRGRFVPIY